MAKLDLDVDAPEKVLDVLQRAIETYYQAEADLTADWQDRAAGRPWLEIARALERAQASIEKAFKRIGYRY